MDDKTSGWKVDEKQTVYIVLKYLPSYLVITKKTKKKTTLSEGETKQTQL